MFGGDSKTSMVVSQSELTEQQKHDILRELKHKARFFFPPGRLPGTHPLTGASTSASTKALK
jgi:hypothetical protein